MYSTKIFLPLTALMGASFAQTSASLDCSQSVSYFIANAPTMAPELLPYLDGPFNTPVHTLPDGSVTTLPPDTLADPEGYVEVVCAVASELPSSVLPAFQSFGQGLLSYGSVHISEYDQFVRELLILKHDHRDLHNSRNYLNSILLGTGGLCQPTATPGGSANGTLSTTPAPTATGTNSTSGSYPTSVVIAAASKPTGVFVGAAAVGGLIGAVMLL
ncbi:hypothetical protein F5B22DRAFT_652639 [Xylaria bambusicola]|uniref:uncharacterized protein n=1 Tax=Xylaria bambusicola TaxID=326684 RepID=UPI002007F26C|nr:uncharacterized protein F5B22DRAFT_652639 [Xylaria bambusicola]KAI0502887.1 hypothetical protein F5B22DRAFT_652639 [Xylaria bambusicola]